ncbi:MAG: hypothetical protein M3Q90_05655 [Candidatus Dormibacteraeota bacterium]|nr:hypothetical protein [Candidatus Dormibacteraeota bacterium]
MAAVPVYSYPMAVPTAHPARRRFGTSQIAIAGGLLAIVAVVTVAVTAIAVSQAIGGKNPPCTVNCAPKIVTPLPASNTYRSSAFKYEVDYSSAWTVRSQDANGVVLGTRLGMLQVVGSKGGQPLDQVIRSAVAALPSAQWQNVAQVSEVKGAHIGDQGGLGTIYSANLIGANSTSTKVRLAVIAATSGGVTVVMVASDPADLKSTASGIPEAQDFDYLCAEFRWS